MAPGIADADLRSLAAEAARHQPHSRQRLGTATRADAPEADDRLLVAVPVTIDDLMREARDGLRRLMPRQAWAAVDLCDALIVDIREDDQRAGGGAIPGARVVGRNALEWRADPRSGYDDPVLTACRGPLVLLCQQGYQSSLAAATLQRLGRRATDVVDGFEGWLAAGLPILDRDGPR